MLNVDKESWIEWKHYAGIKEDISRFEEANLPACHYCGSDNTASVQCGLVGRTMNIAAATTKFKLFPNSPKAGKYFCNACNKCFD